jgi:peroxin-6
MLYLGISETHQAQLKIIEALTRKFKLEPQIRLDQVAEQCPFNYTGADFYALCSDAMLKAMSRKAEDIDRKIGEYLISKFWPERFR